VPWLWLQLPLPSHCASSQSPSGGAVTSVQGLPTTAYPSDGQVADEPLQFSATSHSPADARHSVLPLSKLQSLAQHSPGGSQSSPVSMVSLPHTAVGWQVPP
jgi:hypothetical protein